METIDILGKQRVNRWFLDIIAISGFCIHRKNVHKKYLIILTLILTPALSVLFYSMYYFINDMESLAVIMHHTMLLLDVVISAIYSYYRRDTIIKICTGMSESYDYKSPLITSYLDDVQKKSVEEMEKVYKYIVFSYLFMQINVVISSFVEKYLRNVKFILLFPCWFPFDLSFLPYHIMAYMWQYMIVVFIATTICGAMALTYIVYSHLTTQIALLNFALERSKDRAYELANYNTKMQHNNKRMNLFSDSKDGDNFEIKLKNSYIRGTNQCAKHHLNIISYYCDANDIFKTTYFIIIITGLVLLISTGFTLVSDNTSLKIKFVGVTAVQMIYLYIFCWFGEAITELGERIRITIYGIEWYEMPKESQSSLKLMIERSLRTFSFSTTTGQKVDLDNYMNMVKASYSYFNMMLTAQQKQ